MIIDATTLTTFLQCPRRMYFRFRKHWQPEAPNIHLVFGISWHEAKEHILHHPEDIQGAMELFLEEYRKHYTVQQDAINAPKAPANALDALITYAEKVKGMDREVLYTEVAGLAPLADDVDVAFKIDAIVRDERGLWVIDHKTGSRLTAAWTDGWTTSAQLAIYVHVLNHFFGAENVMGARVEGTIFRKNDHEHVEVPVMKSTASFGALIWSIIHTIDLIKWNIAEEEKATPDDEILTAWPMNPHSCFDFGRKCLYWDYCVNWSNPTGRSCPCGFKVEEWNPLHALEGRQQLEKQTDA